MFQHEDCRGFDILNHAIRIGNSENEYRTGARQTSAGVSEVSQTVVSPTVQSSNSFQFPWKLYDMLEHAEQDGLQDIVAWQGEGAAYGTSFKVFKPQVFVEKVMPRYFKQTKYKSFQRQLNLYGYTRINEGYAKGGYKHKYFLRGNKALCQYISRQPNEENSSNAAGASSSSSSSSSLSSTTSNCHRPQITSSIHTQMIAPKNASNGRLNTVSPGASVNHFAPESAELLCDKREINHQYRALIQKDYQFPWKLYEMLENAELHDYDHIVSWQPPENSCFRVNDPQMFVSTVMPRFFKQTKYKSFQRQLNLYGFSRIDEGPNRGSYRHKLFQKDRKDLLCGMNRQKNGQSENRSQMRSHSAGKRPHNASKERSEAKENVVQKMDVSDPVSSSTEFESQGNEVKCIDHGIPVILQSMAIATDGQDEGPSCSSRSSDTCLTWRRAISDGSSDWIIVVLHNDTFERESFYVHRRVLCDGERKCSFFAKMFENSSASVVESVLVLGAAEAAIFSKVLDYVYFNTKLKLDMQSAFSFFMIGKNLGIQSLRQEVVRFYSRSLNKDNIGSFIQIVSEFEDNTLLEAAVNCFVEEMESMDLCLAGKLQPQILRQVLSRKKDWLERQGCDALTTSRYVAESLHNHANSLSRDQLLQMVDEEILKSIDAVAAIKLLAVETLVCDSERIQCTDSSLRNRCVSTIAKDWSRLRREFEKSPTLVNAFKSVSSEVLYDILMQTTQ